EASQRARGRHARRLDLRPRSSGAELHDAHHETLSRPSGDRQMSTIKFTIDGIDVEAAEGETIWQVAQRHDVAIPHLCYSTAPTYRPDGNCRACMVEIEGERVLAASCLRKPTPGMKVGVETARAKASRKMVFELLVADQPERATSRDPDSKFW